jgi:predicted DNA-binding transcriptional regulator YafY
VIFSTLLTDPIPLRMNQVGIFERMNTILYRVHKGPVTFEEIRNKLEQLAELQGQSFNYSLRSFQRDLSAIRSTFGIEIRGSKRSHTYQIHEEDSGPINAQLRESFDLIHTFQLTKGLEEFVFFDAPFSKGTEYLHELVAAIKKRRIIRVDHHRDFDKKPSRREIRPLALKEVNNSWYLIGLNEQGELRNYGLDRLENLQLSQETFKKPSGLDLHAHYRHVFGIFNNPNAPVEQVLLRFAPQRGHYLKAKPLHPSQEVLEDSEEGLTLSLSVKINAELIGELLSFGDQVSILQPQTLKAQVRELLLRMLAQVS